MFYYNIPYLIKELRLKKGLTQKSLAEGICSTEYISKIEHGKKSPSHHILEQLFQRLGENCTEYMILFNHDTQDTTLFEIHQQQIEEFLLASEYNKAEDLIKKIERSYAIYHSGEPLQYLLTKKSQIFANLYKNFSTAIELCMKAMQITKPLFDVHNLKYYPIYTVNELWTLIHLSAAYFFNVQKKDMLSSFFDPIKAEDTDKLYLTIADFVLKTLDSGYINAKLLTTLYPVTTFYLGKYYALFNQLEQAITIAQKGIDFFIAHYNMPLQYFGKLFFIQSYSHFLLDKTETSDKLSKIGSILIHLCGNKSSVELYSLEENSYYSQVIKLYKEGKL